MKIKKTSLWIRWAYLPELLVRYAEDLPDRTDLCSIFWRSVLLTPMVVVVLVILSPLILLVLGNCWCMVKIEGTKLDKFLTKKRDGGVMVAILKDIKHKTCTMVEIID